MKQLENLHLSDLMYHATLLSFGVFILSGITLLFFQRDYLFFVFGGSMVSSALILSIGTIAQKKLEQIYPFKKIIKFFF